MNLGPRPIQRLNAKILSTLPDEMRYRGEPTEWVRVTRPGQRLDAFLEGALVMADGRIWVVDVPYGRIFSVGADGTGWRTELQYDGEPHAIQPEPDGSFTIADYRDGLLRWTPGDSPRPMLRGANTERFRGLGEMARAANGDLWVSDPGRSSLSDPSGRVWRLRREGEAGYGPIELILDDVPYPNGIAFSPNGAFAYVAATRSNAVWRLNAEFGDPRAPMVGIHIQMSGGLGPDGMAMRSDGLLAVAQAQAGRVVVCDPLGDVIAIVYTPGGLWTTSVAWLPGSEDLVIVDAQTSTLFTATIPALGAAS